MITTRQVNVNLSKGKLKLRHVTTKGIDIGVRVEPPKTPIKTKSITTTTLPDVADMAEKKRRDDIMAEKKVLEKAEKKAKAIEEKKLAMKDEKKIVMVDNEGDVEITESSKTIDEARTSAESEPADVEIKKKPWKEMTDEEKKLMYKERAKRAAATRAAKKKK